MLRRVSNPTPERPHLRYNAGEGLIDRLRSVALYATALGGGVVVRGLGILLSLPLLSLLVAMGGCALMPASGPSSWDVWAGQHDPKNIPYAFVRVTPKVATILAKAAPRLVSDFPDRSRPRDIRFGIGDVLSVTIFEASSGGLFIPAEGSVRPGNFVTIPAQAVDVNGNISIPYAGTIRARGRTQVEVQQAIVDGLKDRAIEPQVVVSVAEQKTSLITVIGEKVSAYSCAADARATS